MIGCTNYLNVQIHTCRKRFSFIWGCFFPVSILKEKIFCFHLIKYLPTALRKNCFVTICEYTVLKTQFWYVNCALVARISKNFEQNMSCFYQMFKTKAAYSSSENQSNVFNLVFTSKFTFRTSKQCFSTLLAIILWSFLKNELRWKRENFIWKVNFKGLQTAQCHNNKNFQNTQHNNDQQQRQHKNIMSVVLLYLLLIFELIQQAAVRNFI